MHKLSVGHKFDCSSVHRAKASLTKASLPCRTVAVDVLTSNSQSLALQHCTTRREGLLVLPSKLNYSELQLRHSRSRDFAYQALSPLIFHRVQRSIITRRVRGGEPGDEASKSLHVVSILFKVSARTVSRYVDLFLQSGDVVPRTRSYGPNRLLGDYEQLILLRIIIESIYLEEIQSKLCEVFGVDISAPTICRTLKIMGCSRQRIQHIALQHCEDTRARFMAKISIIL